jgi:steroid delta-isomerase-like uncharacterized protein
MTREEIRTLVESWVRAFAAEDLEALLALYDPQAELVSPMLHTQRGVGAIERSHQDLFHAFADVKLDIHDIVIDVDSQHAALIFTAHGTQHGDLLGFPPSHRRTATPSIYVFRLNDGRIIAERRVYDYGGVLMQLGIIKPRLT